MAIKPTMSACAKVLDDLTPWFLGLTVERQRIELAGREVSQTPPALAGPIFHAIQRHIRAFSRPADRIPLLYLLDHIVKQPWSKHLLWRDLLMRYGPPLLQECYEKASQYTTTSKTCVQLKNLAQGWYQLLGVRFLPVSVRHSRGRERRRAAAHPYHREPSRATIPSPPALVQRPSLSSLSLPSTPVVASSSESKLPAALPSSSASGTAAEDFIPLPPLPHHFFSMPPIPLKLHFSRL